MANPRTFGAGRLAFLVERYLPAAAAEELQESVLRLGRRCTEGRSPGDGVEYLQSAYLPIEDTCFCLFRAGSIEAVVAINKEAGFAIDRITSAVLLYPGDRVAPNP